MTFEVCLNCDDTGWTNWIGFSQSDVSSLDEWSQSNAGVQGGGKFVVLAWSEVPFRKF
jgi:hypothetical protein